MLGALAFLLAPGVSPPLDPCIADSSATAEYVESFRFMLDQKSPHRGSIPIPLTPRDSISAVATGPECAAALAAYNSKSTAPGQPPRADSVVVIRIGDHHFAVVNPDVPDHESLEYLIFDANWTYRFIISP
jgi:hypothetical protein